MLKYPLGVTPIVYLSPSFISGTIGEQYAAPLKKYTLWIANYTTRPEPTVPTPWDGWIFWQYSEHGTTDGINDNEVDLDWYNGTFASLNAMRINKRKKKGKKSKKGRKGSKK